MPRAAPGDCGEPDPLAPIRSLEERTFNAWPALETLLVDGWVLRFANGYTKRANSVNAWHPQVPVEAVIRMAQPLYARQDQPLIFRLSPLAGPETDAALAAQGFQALDETIVMTAPIDAATVVDPAVRVAAISDAAWSNGFAEANRVAPQHRQTHDRMLAALRLPVAFANLTHEDRAVAWGLAVAERGKVGLFDIVTAPGARRQGAGRRLVTSLLAWGRAAGATSAYLQVVANNAPAIPLYQSLGFTEAYRYHYRVRPSSP